MTVLSDGRPTVVGVELLTDAEAKVLAFEHRRWLNRGAKDEAITVELGLTPVRYYQLLDALIDKPAALVADPMTVKRLHRLRSSRQRARSA